VIPFIGGRHRLLRALIVLALILGIAYVVLDLLVRADAERQLSRAIEKATRAKSASVNFDTLPFLWDIVVHGRIAHVAVDLGGVPAGALDISHVRVVASGVRIDRQLLVTSRRLSLLSVSSAGASVTVTSRALSQAVGHQVHFASGGASVRLGTITLPASLRLDGALMSLYVRGVPIGTIDLARNPVVPSCPMRLRLTRGTATLSCHVAPVPHSLLRVLSSSA
jgi:hypothetical protein